MDASYCLDVSDKRVLLLLTGIEPCVPCHSANNVVTILYSLSRLPLTDTSVLIQSICYAS